MIAPTPVYVVGVRDVASFFNKSISWSRDAMARGIIRSAKIGSEWRTSWAFVQEYIVAHERGANPVPTQQQPPVLSDHQHANRVHQLLNGRGR